MEKHGGTAEVATDKGQIRAALGSMAIRKGDRVVVESGAIKGKLRTTAPQEYTI
jgi:hypothetical protein